MSTQITKEQFELIYNETYNKTLKYIICKCNKLEDVNDIIQDTYVELYKNLKRKNKLEIQKIDDYIIGITKNILKKYYKNKKQNLYMLKNEINEELTYLKDDFDLEASIITKENVRRSMELYRIKRRSYTKNIFTILLIWHENIRNIKRIRPKRIKRKKSHI